jgi:hypothetical protein
MGVTHVRWGLEGGRYRDSEIKPAGKSTHDLCKAERGTRQESERKPVRKRNSRPVEWSGSDKSGQFKKATDQGVLTPCRVQE